MWKTRHLQYEEWDCEKCEKKLDFNRYRLSDLSPIKFCFECKKLEEKGNEK